MKQRTAVAQDYWWVCAAQALVEPDRRTDLGAPPPPRDIKLQETAKRVDV